MTDYTESEHFFQNKLLNCIEAIEPIDINRVAIGQSQKNPLGYFLYVVTGRWRYKIAIHGTRVRPGRVVALFSWYYIRIDLLRFLFRGPDEQKSIRKSFNLDRSPFNFCRWFLKRPWGYRLITPFLRYHVNVMIRYHLPDFKRCRFGLFFNVVGSNSHYHFLSL